MNETTYTLRKILDHGFIRLVDYLGDDTSIVNAARVSYGEGTRKTRDDRALIRYLLRNKHTSPFEQAVFTFHIKLPLFIARQWQRHRTARLNEISARYSVMPEEFYLPDGCLITKQSENNKQGRKEEPLSKEEQEEARQILAAHYKQSYALYQSLLEKGIAREIARICLPLSIYTEMYWQIDLHNLFHFLALRMHEHAQYEICVYANEMYNIVHTICPISSEAFNDYILHKTEFYANEYSTLKQLLVDKCDSPTFSAETSEDSKKELLDNESYMTSNIAGIVEQVDLLSTREKAMLLKKVRDIITHVDKEENF